MLKVTVEKSDNITIGASSEKKYLEDVEINENKDV